MMLVETYSGESDAEFRTAIDAILQSVNPECPNWWQLYEVRGAYEYRSIRFRHLFCIAGSVEGWIWRIARKGRARRVILLPDSAMVVTGIIQMVGAGQEISIAATEIRTI